MSLLFADIFEAIRILRMCKGTTEKCIMNYVEKKVGGCLGVAHTLKTIRTLHKLVEDGVLVKKGKRYLLPPKKPKCKKKCQSQNNCNKCESQNKCNKCEDACKDPCEDQGDNQPEDECDEEPECDDDCDDDENLDEDDEDEFDEDDDDEECDKKDFRADRGEDEIQAPRTKNPKGLRSEVSRIINDPLINGRSLKEGNYRPTLNNRRNESMNKCVAGKSTGKCITKSSSEALRKSSGRTPMKPSTKTIGKTCKSIGKSSIRRNGNLKAIKNENNIKKGSKMKPDIEPRKGGTGKIKPGPENLNKTFLPRRESRIRRNKLKRSENINKRESSIQEKPNRSRSPVKKCKTNAYQALKLEHSMDLGHFFQEPLETEVTAERQKSGDNLNMDFNFHSSPSGVHVKVKEKSCSNLAERKFKEDVKMETVTDGKSQDTFKRTLEEQVSGTKAAEKKRFNKDGDENTKSKGDMGSSLCSVCEKKKRSS